MSERAIHDRLAHRLRWHQAIHDAGREPRNRSHWVPELRRWQSARLAASFAHVGDDPARGPALTFFLEDVYGDRDFSRRNADIARTLPVMGRLLPARLLRTVADALEVSALSHTLDLHMAAALQPLAPRRRRLDAALYQKAYRLVGRQPLRHRQIRLVSRVAEGFAGALQLRGVPALLAFSRGPARLLGLTELRGFLERGYSAFEALGDAPGFAAEIERDEHEVARRLFAGHPAPYARACTG